MAQRVGLCLGVLAAIVALGIVLRAGHLGHPMRYDESYNYLHFVVKGPGYFATHYLPNNHILHTFSVWMSGKVAGHSPAALRLPAFVAGVLLIPATGLLGWMISRRMAVVLLASLAVATSSALIEYSVNARGYSMLALLAVLATLLVIHAMRKPEAHRRWMGWGAIGAAGMYTVPVMALPLMGMGTYVLVRAIGMRDRVRRSVLMRGLIIGAGTCTALTILAYLPIVAVEGLAAFSKSQQLAYDILGRQVVSTVPMLLTAGSLWIRHVPLLLELVLPLAVAVHLVQSFRMGLECRWILLSVLIVPFLLAVFAAAPMPARTWVFALPFIHVMVACGLSDVVNDQVSVVRRVGAIGGQCALAVLLLVSGARVWKSPELVSEPGGLVLVEPALTECVAFGTDKCALVAPFNPAMSYYKARLRVDRLCDPANADTQRVYVLADALHPLDHLWRPGVGGYENFTKPQRLWERPGGVLYVAERAARNALR